MYKQGILLIYLMLLALLSCDGLLDTYESSVAYKLRDRGPAGGWIFYINPNWERDGWRYLEAAPSDLSGTVQWDFNGSPPNTNAKATAVGTGKANTTIIVGVLGAGSYAALLCDTLPVNGYNDWFLPSKGELELMCWNLRGKNTTNGNNPDVPNVAGAGIGGFILSSYWSSSENSQTEACTQNFNNGVQYDNTTKSNYINVRAIRAF